MGIDMGIGMGIGMGSWGMGSLGLGRAIGLLLVCIIRMVVRGGQRHRLMGRLMGRLMSCLPGRDSSTSMMGRWRLRAVLVSTPASAMTSSSTTPVRVTSTSILNAGIGGLARALGSTRRGRRRRVSVASHLVEKILSETFAR